jgi:hypothetical protein
LCLLLVDEGSTARYTFRIMKTIVVVGLLACSGLAVAQSQSTSTAEDPEKAAVLSVVTRMFDAMATRDVSHCGVDVFEFLKVGDEWRMSNASWTVEAEKCPPSPLGPIKPQGGDRNRK